MFECINVVNFQYGMPVNEAFDLMSNYTKLVRLKGKISKNPID